MKEYVLCTSSAPHPPHRWRKFFGHYHKSPLDDTPRLASIVCELLTRGHLLPTDLQLYLAQLRFYTFLSWSYLGAIHRERSAKHAANSSVPDPYIRGNAAAAAAAAAAATDADDEEADTDDDGEDDDDKDQASEQQQQSRRRARCVLSSSRRWLMLLIPARYPATAPMLSLLSRWQRL